jgi:putative membrane protein
MLLVAQILTALVCLIHIYIFLLETVLFRSRGVKVFGIPKAEVEMRVAAMSNQGCYNGFFIFKQYPPCWLYPHCTCRCQVSKSL